MLFQDSWEEQARFLYPVSYTHLDVYKRQAQDTVKQLVDEHMLDKDYYAAVDDYNAAILNGKMCIRDR